MYFVIKLLSGKTISSVTENTESTIINLLLNIENTSNLHNIPFAITHNKTILNWNDRSKLYEIFTSEKSIILTIIIYKKIPEKFDNFEHLINYINYLNISNKKYLDKLGSIYMYEYDEQHEIIKTNIKIINIHFILNFIQIYRILPSNIDSNIFSNELFYNKQFIMITVQNNEYALEYASKDLQNDREIVIAAVTNNGYALEYASKELKNDREIVKIAVKNDGMTLQFASENLQNDKEIVIIAVQNYGNALYYTSKDLQNDREIVKIAVSHDKNALEYASQELQNDKEIVMTAVRHDKNALQFASKYLQNDKEIKKMINN